MALFTFRTNKKKNLLTSEHYFHWNYVKNVHVHVTNIDWFENRGNVRVRQHWGAVVQPWLLQKSIKYYLFLVFVCSLSYSAWIAHAPYCHL
jgi:hypothetical protein